MKTGIKNYGTFFIAALLMSFSTIALANDSTIVKEDTTPVEFKYIGKIKNQPVFQLNVPNAEKDEYTIIITDDAGAQLYFNRVKGENITKKFMVNVEEMEGSSLRVEVRARKQDKTTVFQISNDTRFVTETSVSKL